MNSTFYMNGYLWRVKQVAPNNPMLVDRTGLLRVATTDPRLRIIFIADNLSEQFTRKVLVHELGHCAICSFHLEKDIHRMVEPSYWIEAEEWLCNFLVDYNDDIYKAYYQIFG